MLLVIDNAPLQATAWAELLRARRRLEKATRDVHRHEENDQPAFLAWLTQTFPVLLSTIRDLAQQTDAKMRLVQAVQSEAFFTGRAPGTIWRAWKKHGGRPPSPEPDDTSAGTGSDAATGFDSESGLPDLDAVIDEEVKRMFAEEGIDEDDPFAQAFQDFARGVFGVDKPELPVGQAAGAREIYRRLVRHLHPDRGGEWTAARARLWEQVQAAWDACDADWLARLEAEWEAHAEVLGLTSAVGRLRAALAELEAARRDAERRVRQYRKDDAWRFSLQPPTDKLRSSILGNLHYEEAALRQQLAELEAMIAQWEHSGRPRRSRRKRRPVAAFDLF